MGTTINHRTRGKGIIERRAYDAGDAKVFVRFENEDKIHRYGRSQIEDRRLAIFYSPSTPTTGAFRPHTYFDDYIEGRKVIHASRRTGGVKRRGLVDGIEKITVEFNSQEIEGNSVPRLYGRNQIKSGIFGIDGMLQKKKASGGGVSRALQLSRFQTYNKVVFPFSYDIRKCIICMWFVLIVKTKSLGGYLPNYQARIGHDSNHQHGIEADDMYIR